MNHTPGNYMAAQTTMAQETTKSRLLLLPHELLLQIGSHLPVGNLYNLVRTHNQFYRASDLLRALVTSPEMAYDVLCDAASTGNLKLMRTLIEDYGAPLYLIEHSHWISRSPTLLHEAAKHGQVAISEYLLDCKWDNGERCSRSTHRSLWIATELGHREIIRHLKPTCRIQTLYKW